MSAGVPSRAAASSLASTTFPAGSTAARAVPAGIRVPAKAAASWMPLCWARIRSLVRAASAAPRSQGSTASVMVIPGQETLSTASGSSVTTSRTDTPAQVQVWNPAHQCSGPRTRTGECDSRAVPMPLVPLAHSDQDDQGARLHSAAASRQRRSPQAARIRPSASATVTTPSRPSTSRAATDASPPSSANMASCSMACVLSSAAAGARSRPGLTLYSSRHLYQDMRISGRTPRTLSAPAANRSRASLVRLRLVDTEAAPLAVSSAPLVGSSVPFIPYPLVGGRVRLTIGLADAPTT